MNRIRKRMKNDLFFQLSQLLVAQIKEWGLIRGLIQQFIFEVTILFVAGNGSRRYFKSPEINISETWLYFIIFFKGFFSHFMYRFYTKNDMYVNAEFQLKYTKSRLELICIGIILCIIFYCIILQIQVLILLQFHN